MKQPDFLIGGSTRSGSRALMQILSNHPQIFLPERKEHQFFHQDSLHKPALESCKQHFEDAVNHEQRTKLPKDRTLHCEQEHNPERAHTGCPNAKIIFTLRNPVERAYIQFQYALAERKETVKTFERAMEAELAGLRSPDTTGRCWIYKNQYQTHLDHWLSFYPKDKILLFIYEEWIDPSHSSLRSLEQFLGLENSSLSLEHATNHIPQEGHLYLPGKKPRKYPTLSDATREQLEDTFSVDKTYISNLIGRDIPAWC